MPKVQKEKTGGLFGHWPDVGAMPKYRRWFLFVAVAAVFTFLLELPRLPAGFLLGPMLAGIILAVSNINIKTPPFLFVMAQGVIGCLVARSITNSILSEMLADWPVFAVGVVSVIIAATFIGYLLARQQVLPGTTAIWGSAPGAASAMVLMAEAYGADERLVAVMQYLRVFLVTMTGSLLALLVAPSPTAALTADFCPPVELSPLATTALIAFGGALVAKHLRIPAGGMLVPLVLAMILQNIGLVTLVLPPWLLAVSYSIIGCTIGLRFSRPILVHALSVLPILFLSTLTLMTVCAGLAFLLSWFSGVDLMTAYLATSPGGADTVAIIAASTPVNLPFVTAYQTLRFLLVTLTGPVIARAIARHIIRITSAADKQGPTETPPPLPKA